MPSHYSVIQYYPDPVTDERINIGIIAFDNSHVDAVFLKNWERVKRFAGNDVEMLKDFEREMQDGIAAASFLPGLGEAPAITKDVIIKMSQRWINSIQLTPVRGSLESLDETLREMSSRFLIERERSARDYRDRAKAASIAKAGVRDAMRNVVGGINAESLLKISMAIAGKRTLHTFDGVVMNGRPYFAVHGISFEPPRADELEDRVDALSWAIADVKDELRDIEIGVLMLPPLIGARHNALELHRRASGVYKSLGARVLTEKNLAEWSYEQSLKIPKDIYEADKING